jgi:hypothetical protein
MTGGYGVRRQMVVAVEAVTTLIPRPIPTLAPRIHHRLVTSSSSFWRDIGLHDGKSRSLLITRKVWRCHPSTLTTVPMLVLPKPPAGGMLVVRCEPSLPTAAAHTPATVGVGALMTVTAQVKSSATSLVIVVWERHYTDIGRRRIHPQY